ncbi:tRNA (uracil-5-)-methyltransferase [Enterococcus faecalis]|uniref:tRNA (uracil-5-)-methyltransferase n=1 Tax=Enterococcus faecalis TaxID=1351 RepID=UPI0013647645|nr:tRNA (uracil-5-)-methyltransferase [Enterococcus faecalis]NBJ47179.1 tRNA (uracil-5-)-methyltransferase [Enterococcus faecalis]
MKKTTFVGICIIIFVSLITTYCFYRYNSKKQEIDSDAVDWIDKKNKDTPEIIRNIEIPGFSELNILANEIKQPISFHNPEVNECYFKITLLTKDGEKLWQSKLIEPGKGMYEIHLEKKLSVGTYENARIKYECFTLDESQSPLNGSEIEITLNVA